MNKRIKPTLFVGLGGTGYVVLSLLKKRINKAFGRIPPVVNFLVMDIDDSVPKDLQSGDPRFDEEFWRIDLNTVGDIHNNVQVGMEGYDYMADWWPEDLHENVHLKNVDPEQAYQHRCLGRTGIFVNARSFHRRISGMRLDIMGQVARSQTRIPASGTGARKKLMPADVMNGANVYLVCSVAGGTGSGMFLDAAAMLHQEFAGVQGCDFVGALFMPSVFSGAMADSDQDTSKMYGNAYGALKELDHFMLNGGFQRSYAGNISVDIGRKPLMDRVLLVDRDNENQVVMGNRRAISDLLAEFIFHEVTGLSWDVGAGIASQLSGAAKITKAGPTVAKAYFTGPGPVPAAHQSNV